MKNNTYTQKRAPMTFDDVTDILKNSTQADWIVDDQSGSFTYKKDLNLHIHRSDFEDYREFKESWANSHADQRAATVDYIVRYGSSFVAKQTLVSVDGYRANIPMPISHDNLKVRASEVNFARIVNVGGKADEYIRRSGFEIIEDDED